jgi:hypothetical protein
VSSGPAGSAVHCSRDVTRGPTPVTPTTADNDIYQEICRSRHRARPRCGTLQ